MQVICGSTPYVNLTNYYELFRSAGLSFCDREKTEQWYQDILVNHQPSKMADVQPSGNCQNQAKHLLNSTVNNAPKMLLSKHNKNALVLNYWRKEIQDGYFLLLYGGPTMALAHALDNGANSFDFIQDWKRSAKQILAFQKHNRQRSILVHADNAIAQPNKLLEVFIDKVPFKNKPIEADFPFSDSTPSALSLSLSEVIISNDIEINELLNELEASAIPFEEGKGYMLPTPIELEEDFKYLLNIKKQVEVINKELSDKNAEIDYQKSAQKELEQENELLLLQLHQVQEELESLFIKSNSEKENHVKEIENLKKQKTESDHCVGKLNDEIKRLKEQKNKTDQVIAELTNEVKEIQTLKKSKQDDVKLIDQLKDELANKANDKTQNDAIKELEQENELLLLQLHQVQEELEHYFIENQKLTGSIKSEDGLDDNKIILSPSEEKALYKKVTRKKIKELFSPHWYRRNRKSKYLPLWHYLMKGWKKQFSPHPLFDPQYYIEANHLHDLKKCPLVHFLALGNVLEYSPHPLFDSKWYLSQYPDVKKSGINPLIHYLKFGAQEGRNPSRHFNTLNYLNNYPDVKESGINPLVHYVTHGQEEGRSPH